MAEIPKILPEQIAEIAQAFTRALEMENTVFQNQLNGIVDMVADAMERLIALSKDAVSIEDGDGGRGLQQTLDSVKQKAISQLQDAAASTGKTEVPKAAAAAMNSDPGQDLATAAVHALSISFENAVTAQQQVSILQQAATSMTISTILSVTTAVTGVATSNVLKKGVPA